MTLQEIQILKRELTRHDYRYYILHHPIISDQEYDRLYQQYKNALVELVGKDTRSLETECDYPLWIKVEFKDVKPLT